MEKKHTRGPNPSLIISPVGRNEKVSPWGSQLSAGPLEIATQREQWPLCDLAETGHAAGSARAQRLHVA